MDDKFINNQSINLNYNVTPFKTEENCYRFIIVIIYCLLNFSSGFQWCTFSSIAGQFKKIYELDQISIDLFSMSFMILYPFLTPPSSYLVDNISLKLGIVLSSVLSLIGSILKSQLNQNISYAYIGQFITAIAQPLIMNTPGKIASTWFREDKRVLVTTLFCTSNTIGVIFGFLFPNFFFEEEMSTDEYKRSIDKYLFSNLIFNSICCIPSILFFKSKPIIPPSISQIDNQSIPFLSCIKEIFKNKDFILLLISFTSIVGYFNMFGTIAVSLLNSYEIPQNFISYILITSYIIGISSCLIFSNIIDKNKEYKKIFFILNIMGIIFQASLTILLEIKINSIIVFILIVLIFSSLMPLYTCSMDLVCEITHPIGESISGGLIMTFSQFSGIISTLICGYFIDYIPNQKYLSNLICLILMIISFISLSYIKVKLKRYEIDKQLK